MDLFPDTSDLAPITSHIHNWVLFLLFSIPSFFLELLHWSPVAYWAPTDLGSSSFSIPFFLPFHTVHGVLKARILKWFAIPFSSGPHFVRPLHHDPSVLGGPIHAWLSFFELDKTVVHVIRLASFLWLWFHSLSVLWCPLSAPTVLLGFLLLWMAGISSQLLQQNTALFLILGVGYLLTAATPDVGFGYLLSAARCSSAACRSNHISLQSKIYPLG